MKTILVPTDTDEGLDARLQAAFDLARARGGHLVCLQVTPYAAYALGEPALGAFPVMAMMEAIEAGRAEDRQRIEARLAHESISWEWLARDGDPGEKIREAGRLADVVVMNAGPFAHGASVPLALTGDVAIHGPVPVIAVAPGSRGFAVKGAALIAWDGSQEAAQAMRAAIPLLHLATTVDILTVEEKTSDFRARDAAKFLSRHGICAEVIERGDGGQSIEAVIRGVLTERSAAWMVQGAYGHSRLRQAVFGGVTRGLLGDAPVPLVLAH